MNPSNLDTAFEQFKDVCPTNKLASLKMLVKVTRGDEEKIMSKIEEWWHEKEDPNKDITPSSDQEQPSKQHTGEEEDEMPLVTAKPVLSTSTSTSTSTRIVAPVSPPKRSPHGPDSDDDQGRRPSSSTKHIGLRAISEQNAQIDAMKQSAPHPFVPNPPPPTEAEDDPETIKRQAIKKIMRDATIQQGEKTKRIQSVQEVMRDTTLSHSQKTTRLKAFISSSRDAETEPKSSPNAPSQPPPKQGEDLERIKRDAMNEIMRDTTIQQVEKSKRIKDVQEIMHDVSISQLEKATRIQSYISSPPSSPQPVIIPSQEPSQSPEPRPVTPQDQQAIHSCQHHQCPLVLTSSLIYEGENRSDVAGCDVGLEGICEGNGYMSCDKCDWDVCRACFNAGKRQTQGSTTTLRSKKTTQTLANGQVVVTTEQSMSDGSIKRIIETSTRDSTDGSMKTSRNIEITPPPIQNDTATHHLSAISTLSSESQSSIGMALVTGLVSRPELNGKTATVHRFDVATKRYDVSTEEGSQFILALKPINLIFPVGTRVLIDGLKAAAQYNRKFGYVKSEFSKEDGRYVIELDDETKTVLGLKPDNCIATEELEA